MNIIKSNFIKIFMNWRLLYWAILLNVMTVIQRVTIFNDQSVEGIIRVSIVCWGMVLLILVPSFILVTMIDSVVLIYKKLKK